MRHSVILLAATSLLALASCSSSPGSSTSAATGVVTEQESREAKALLQGIWVDEDTEEVSFRVVGDTIFYPDTISQPTYFKIVKDSLVLSAVGTRYAIVKQLEHVFWFKNQNGDVVKLQKSDDPIHVFAFVHDRPQVLTYTEVVKNDSVVFYNGERYHWYIAINPTKYKVHAKSYSNDGMEVDNVYYDNIIHISMFQGATKVFSSDFRKQQYGGKIPAKFLEQSVLSKMEYTGVDAKGFHFVATICIPDGASCYKAENIIAFNGQLSTTLIEY